MRRGTFWCALAALMIWAIGTLMVPQLYISHLGYKRHVENQKFIAENRDIVGEARKLSRAIQGVSYVILLIPVFRFIDQRRRRKK